MKATKNARKQAEVSLSALRSAGPEGLTEREISQAMGYVGRTRLREMLDTLTATGLIERVPQRALSRRERDREYLLGNPGQQRWRIIEKENEDG